MILRKFINKLHLKTIVFSIIIGYSIISYVLKSIVEINFPYQTEFRETAIASVVNLMKNGENPFTYKNLPQYTYVYGLGYPTIINFLTSISNANILKTARALSFISIVISLVLVFSVINKIYQNKNKLIAGLLTLSLVPILEHLAGVGAFPTSLAVLIIVASVTIPFLFNFKNISVTIAVLISIVGFFIKPYCLLGAIYLISYIVIFQNLKFGLITAIIFIFILSLSIALCQYLNPAFLALSYYSFSCANINSVQHMIDQLKHLFYNFLIIKWYIVILILIIIFYKKPRIQFNLYSFQWNKGLLNSVLKFPLNYFGYCSFLGLLAFVLKLGHHQGSGGGTYLAHIFFPFYIIFIANYYFIINKRYLLDYLLIILIFFSSLYMYQAFNNMKHTLSTNKIEILNIENELKGYSNIFNSAENASIILSLKKPIYNNGQTEYFADVLNCESAVKNDSKKAIAKFTNDINIKMKNQYFDLILQTHDYFGRTILNSDTLNKYYYILKIRPTPVGEYSWYTEWWIKKKI